MTSLPGQRQSRFNRSIGLRLTTTTGHLKEERQLPDENGNLKKKSFFTLVGRKLLVINFGRIDDAKVSMGNWRNRPLLIYNCPPLRITNSIPFKYPWTASLFKHHDFWYFGICRLIKTELIYKAIASLAPSRAISSPPCLGSSPRHNYWKKLYICLI